MRGKKKVQKKKKKKKKKKNSISDILSLNRQLSSAELFNTQTNTSSSSMNLFQSNDQADNPFDSFLRKNIRRI